MELFKFMKENYLNYFRAFSEDSKLILTMLGCQNIQQLDDDTAQTNRLKIWMSNVETLPACISST